MQSKKRDERAVDTPMNGDTTFYDRYAHTILAYVQLHISSREDAEDVMLEVFMAAFEHHNLAGLAEQEQLLWLRRVARNKLANIYRHLQRHPSIALDNVAESLYDDEGRSPESIILRQERYRQLHIAINSLSLLQQQLLQLRFGYGLRFAEIAILLDKREAALRKLLSRTLTSLRATYSILQREGKAL